MTVWTILFMLMGGLALFLFGMEQLSGSVRTLAGHKIKDLLNVFTKRKSIAVLFGVVFTILFQSSSAASVVLVSFVEAGLIQFVQTIPVLLGTGLGTTLTAHIISFNIGQFALLALSLGFFFGTFSKGRYKHAGYLVMGLGLIFYGMQLMSIAMEPLRDNEQVKMILAHTNNPVLGLLVGLLMTALIQSSAAFIGLLITLLSGHLLTFDQCLPMIIGTNIGTTVTALLASIKASGKAVKVAFVNAFFRLAAGLVFILILPYWNALTWWVTESGSGSRAIANAHTIFNIGMVILMFPFVGLVARYADKVSWNRTKTSVSQLKYLTSEALVVDGLVTSVLKLELADMGRLVGTMVSRCMEPFFDRSAQTIKEIREMENEVDQYREQINAYLVRTHRDLSIESWGDEAFRLLHIMNELEQIADIVSVSIMHHAEEWLKKDISFSDEGKRELEAFHARCVKQLSRALSMIENADQSKAMRLKRKYRKYAYMAFDLEVQHYKRLFVNKSTTAESGKVHIELINLLRVINSRATNFGRILLLDESQEHFS